MPHARHMRGTRARIRMMAYLENTIFQMQLDVPLFTANLNEDLTYFSYLQFVRIAKSITTAVEEFGFFKMHPTTLGSIQSKSVVTEQAVVGTQS